MWPVGLPYLITMSAIGGSLDQMIHFHLSLNDVAGGLSQSPTI